MSWWSTSLEIILLLISLIGLISSILFIVIVIIRHDFRQNLALLLVVNLNIGGYLTCLSLFSNAIYMLFNSGQDQFCSFRAYLFTLGGLYIFQAALLQCVHRLFVTVFVHFRQWQNRCLFISLALIQFLICSVALLPLLINNRFVYYSNAQTCYIAFNDIIGVLYPSICFYFIPLTIQTSLSLWILQDISHRTRAAHACLSVMRRIRKERRVLLRLALPVISLVSVGLIYLIFFFLTNITHEQWQPPPYALHLSFIGSSIATTSSILLKIFLHYQVKQVLLSFLQVNKQNIIHVLN